MIDKALNALVSITSDYLSMLPELNIGSEANVKLSHIIKNDGTMGMQDNTLGVTLMNVEEERNLPSTKAWYKTGQDKIEHVNPVMRLNLYVLFTAHFKEHKASLQYISGVVSAFQSKNVFTPQNTPVLDETIEKLIVELYTLNLEQQHQLWGVIGAKYLPSLMYKVRIVAIQQLRAKDSQEPILGIGITAGGKAAP
ncbi:MAG: DUF4255 domain-containing protein [Chitinivibrionales bacterium]|nr:DUF4255 domain-containing protein [Chitinivibrionales bacterium]